MGWWARWRGRELPERAEPPTHEGGALRDGKKHGVWIEKGQEGWHSGFLESTYRDGVRHGPYRFWHGAGFVHERGVFVDGAKEGEASFFDHEGRRFAIATWRAGKWHGAYREYGDDGAVKLEREYRDGTIFAGPYELRSRPDGAYIWRKAFRDGHPIGAFEEYQLGKLKLRRTYDDDGVLDGPWSDHHDGGAVALEGAYTRGVRSGVWTSRRKDGSVIATCDYDGDRAWRAGEVALDVRDDGELDRWIALADVWGAPKLSWSGVERAIDAFPEADRERAVAWVEGRIGAHRIVVGIGDWLGALLGGGDDPRCRLIDGISTDHGRFRAEHVAQIVRHAAALRVLSFTEEDLEPGVEALFPPGVAWPKLEHLWIFECGPLGALVRTLAGTAWAAALRELGLDGEGDVTDDDSAALLASPHLAALRTLRLNRFGRCAGAIAAAPMLASLEALELRYLPDAAAVVEAIAARATPALKRLALYGEGTLSRKTIVGLCAKARHPALESLTLHGFDVPETIEAELARRWPSLRVYIY